MTSPSDPDLRDLVAAYLRRVRYDGDLAPSYETLLGLHRAHLDAVPYENLGIMLGRAPSAAGVSDQSGTFSPRPAAARWTASTNARW